MHVIRNLAFATAGVMSLGASCTTTAPNFVYGNVLPTSDLPTQYTVQASWMDQPARLMTFPVPSRPPVGVIRINAFIPDHWLDSPPFPLPFVVLSPVIAASLGISGIGDNRSDSDDAINPNTDAYASRVAIELDFISATGRVVFNQSCIDAHISYLGEGSSPSQTVCLPAHPISSSIGVPGTNGFRTSFVETSGGGFDFYIVMSGLNAFSDYAPNPFNCAIDVGFHIYADQGNIRVDRWEPFNSPPDEYPATESFWYDGAGNPGKRIQSHKASGDGVNALCVHEYHS